MTHPFAGLALVLALQAGLGEVPAQITSELPAQVVADLAREALNASSDDAVWDQLAGVTVETRGDAATVRDRTLAEAAESAWHVTVSWTTIAARRTVASARAHPRIWIGTASLLAVLLMGLLAGHRGTAPRPAKATARRGRRWSTPRAERLLGRGLTTKEVARQTGLSRDLVFLVHHCHAAPNGADATVSLDAVLERATTREGPSSEPGGFARVEPDVAVRTKRSSVELIA